MDPVRGQAEEDGEITDRPNQVSSAAVHNRLSNCRRKARQGRHDAASEPSVKSKNGVLPRETATLNTHRTVALVALVSLILGALAIKNLAPLHAQQESAADQDYEREELGVNRYTAPSITRIFHQLDELKPLPFDQLHRDYSQAARGSREQMALIFGGLIADGFLLVACEKKDRVEDFGRILLRQAQSLSVADRVTRHSASLTELAKRGDWSAVRNELIATQTDVEQAMIELRDQKMAHLISLGGWLRGLEICAQAVEVDFSPERARVLLQPDLINYFCEELRTLPPAVARLPLFQNLRAHLDAIKTVIDSAAIGALSMSEIRRIKSEALESNRALETNP